MQSHGAGAIAKIVLHFDEDCFHTYLLLLEETPGQSGLMSAFYGQSIRIPDSPYSSAKRGYCTSLAKRTSGVCALIYLEPTDVN